MTSDNELKIMYFLKKNPFLFGEKVLSNESLVSLYTECVGMLPIFESEEWIPMILQKESVVYERKLFTDCLFPKL